MKINSLVILQNHKVFIFWLNCNIHVCMTFRMNGTLHVEMFIIHINLYILSIFTVFK